jgi:GH24 family phage-related lysozyme (muramidase)
MARPVHQARRLIRLLLAAAALTLAACGAAPQPAALPSPVTPVEQPPALELQPAVYRVLEPLPPRVPAPIEGLICTRAVDLIVSFEIGSPELYQRKYRNPIWPGAASGATIGIGYDLGHQAPDVIAIDWQAHPHKVRLVTASGVTGPLARDLVRKLADVSVEYGYAREVFDQTSVVEHFRAARRAFGAPFAQAHPCLRGALTSLVFNRGASMNGPARAEMRTIRDVCLPAQDRSCVAREIRAMTRLWKGSAIERGMQRRRDAEADLAETG